MATVQEELEAILDRVGPSVVVDTLAHIHFAKGQHLRREWQDPAAARRWERAGKVLDRVGASRPLAILSTMYDTHKEPNL